MIRSFLDEETQRVFQRERSKKIPPAVQRIGLRKLVMLDAAESLNDLRVPPGNQLKKLRAGRAARYSIRINDQWRVCFRWEQGDAFEVEITDYH